MSWRELTPVEARSADEQRLTELKATRPSVPTRRNTREGTAAACRCWSEGQCSTEHQRKGVAFVLDLTDRKKAEAALREGEQRHRQMELELAHANRVSAKGQLSSSIAHEVTQPIAATAISAETALRWLTAQPPNTAGAQAALARVIKDTKRAQDIVDRIRAFVREAPPRRSELAINEAILEVVALTRNEATKNRISVRTQLAEGLPPVQADRVQFQQVVLNLIINGVRSDERLKRRDPTFDDQHR